MNYLLYKYHFINQLFLNVHYSVSKMKLIYIQSKSEECVHGPSNSPWEFKSLDSVCVKTLNITLCFITQNVNYKRK